MQTVASCPYCGEPNTLSVDEAGGSRQSYVEDCQVCCQPWTVLVTFYDDEPQVELRTVDE